MSDAGECQGESRLPVNPSWVFLWTQTLDSSFSLTPNISATVPDSLIGQHPCLDLFFTQASDYGTWNKLNSHLVIIYPSPPPMSNQATLISGQAPASEELSIPLLLRKQSEYGEKHKTPSTLI